MLQEVKTGDKILAQQYNDLVKAVGGPLDASNETPFTRTSNGVVLNGGQTSYTTKAAASIPALLETQYSTGQLGVGYAGYSSSSSSANRFTGVFLNVGTAGNFMAAIVEAANSTMFSAPLLLIIDPTAAENVLHVVAYNSQLEYSIKQGRLPLCLVNEDAGLAILQITKSSEKDDGLAGSLVAIAGNWKRAGGSDGDKPSRVPKQTLLNIIKDFNIYENATDVRLLQECTLWRGSNWLTSKSDVPNLTYNVGTQHVQILPDAYVSTTGVNGVYGNQLLSTNLSSLAMTPFEQFGFYPLYKSCTSQLFHFDKIEDEHTMWKDIYDTDPTSLSGWDILVRHKAEHPRKNEDESFESQCSAYLDYVPLSGFLAVDSEMDAIKGEADTQCSSIQHNSTDSSLQIFKFDDPTTAVLEQDDFSGYDLVLRDNTGAMAKTNYYNLNSLFNELTSDITAVADVSVDSEVGNLSSIGWDANDALELYNFSQGQRVEKDDKFDIVVRDNEHNKINYTPLSALGSGYPGPWEIEINKQTGDATFTNCVAKVARAYHFFANQTANVGGGDKMVYFVMTHSASPAVHMYVGNYSSAASILGGTDANCISASITPLYRVIDNEVACDFRYMLNIQAYDNRNFSSTMNY